MPHKLLIQMLQHTAACHTLCVTHTVPVPMGQPTITRGNPYPYPYKSVPVPIGTGTGWTPKPAGLPMSLPIYNRLSDSACISGPFRADSISSGLFRLNTIFLSHLGQAQSHISGSFRAGYLALHTFLAHLGQAQSHIYGSFTASSLTLPIFLAHLG
jgi:hypothetical protein